MNKSLFLRPLSWAVAALVVYWVALFTLTHLPSLPRVSDLPNFDKVAHFAGYTGLAFLAAVVLLRRSRWSRRGALVVVLGVMAYGVLDELMQIPVPGRTADVLDWLCDCLGAVTGVIVFRLIQKALAARRTTLRERSEALALSTTTPAMQTPGQ